MQTLHSWLYKTYTYYRSWHKSPYHSHLHWGSFFLICLVSGIFLNVQINSAYSLSKIETKKSAFNYDVVVVGAGTGGVSAAIQAKRMGATVALIEETDWVGGQMTAAGVSTMDEMKQNRDSGIYKEFIDNVKSYYVSKGKSGDFGRNAFEASVGQAVLKNMLSGVTIYYQNRVTSVVVSGNKVTGVVTQRGNTFNAKVVIDATEYGDVIALSGATYRLGNTTSTNLNPSAEVQDITYTAVIKKYPNGVPTGLFMLNPPPGYDDAKLIFQKSYDPNSKYSNAWEIIYGPINWLALVAYRGVPDSSNPVDYKNTDKAQITRTGLNQANDYKITAGDINDLSLRKSKICEAKLKTLQLVYFIQHDMAQPLWAVADDEGYNTAYNTANLCSNIPAEYKTIEANMPVIPYVREARRIVGVKTLTASDIKRVPVSNGSFPYQAQKKFETSLAVGDYPVDVHGSVSDANLETRLERASDLPAGDQWVQGTGRFQLPFEIFIPQTLDGLVVAEKNLSMTRLVNGAARLQPVTMQAGQAAGAIAALAVKNKLNPRNINVPELQETLALAGNRLGLNDFPDVPRGNTFWPYVQLMSTRGFMNGYGTGLFGVNDNITRGQVAVVLANMLKWDTSVLPGTPTFVDVPSTHSFYKQIETMSRFGITSGCSASPKKFCPDAPVTKWQMSIFLAKSFNIDTTTFPITPYYGDLPDSNFAFPFVQKLTELGILGSCSVSVNSFCPDANVNRGEATKMLFKAYEYSFVPK